MCPSGFCRRGRVAGVPPVVPGVLPPHAPRFPRQLALVPPVLRPPRQAEVVEERVEEGAVPVVRAHGLGVGCCYRQCLCWLLRATQPAGAGAGAAVDAAANGAGAGAGDCAGAGAGAGAGAQRGELSRCLLLAGGGEVGTAAPRLLAALLEATTAAAAAAASCPPSRLPLRCLRLPAGQKHEGPALTDGDVVLPEERGGGGYRCESK